MKTLFEVIFLSM